MNRADDIQAGDQTAHRSRRRLGWAAAALGIVLILALLGGFIFYRLVTLPQHIAAESEAEIEHLLQAARRAFDGVVQPRVVVNERVVLEQASPVLELAVFEREVTVERETENTWLESTKKLRIRGTYRVKAGYDLRQPFQVNIDDNQPQTVRVSLPRAKILSVELERLEVLTAENGLWNKVQPDEFETEVNGLQLDARRRAMNEGFAAEAEKMLTSQLEQKLGPDIHLEVAPTPPPRLTAPRR
jgi:hypothetical protein